MLTRIKRIRMQNCTSLRLFICCWPSIQIKSFSSTDFLAYFKKFLFWESFFFSLHFYVNTIYRELLHLVRLYAILHYWLFGKKKGKNFAPWEIILSVLIRIVCKRGRIIFVRIALSSGVSLPFFRKKTH